MKARKFKEITDEMIGMDERVCSCASKVIDMIITADDKKGKHIAQEKETHSAGKSKRTKRNRSKEI